MHVVLALLQAHPEAAAEKDRDGWTDPCLMDPVEAALDCEQHWTKGLEPRWDCDNHRWGWCMRVVETVLRGVVLIVFNRWPKENAMYVQVQV